MAVTARRPGRAQASAEGTVDGRIVEWFGRRGPGDRVAKITAPTLIVQGTIDTLFPPSEAVANFERSAAPVRPWP